MGQGFGSYVVCCAPPDPNASVGPNHIVETVNLDLAVFNKSGALLYGPVPINTLWQGFGGGCQTDNDGDPSVLYDSMADRWIVSQFAVTTTLYLNCVAVSQTPDPTGPYNRYSYMYSDFPDYPKFGVWPDAYYVTFNMFAGGTTFSGGTTCAYDRAKMLAGLGATQRCFTVGVNWGGLLPSTVDGSTAPPAGSPNYVVALDTSSTLASWKFVVDWTTPANTTLAGPTFLNVAPYTSSCSTAPRGACIPQGGTSQRLESLADRLMYRLAYRNFGDHEAMVVNHTIEVGSGSSLHSGVRWYEIRPNASHNLSVFQQGTYAPDSNWRWMASAAMDRSGNIALGYSVGGSVSPQIHYTGRLATDAAGTMSQGENTIINGGGSQTGGLARWGDYTSMAVDPSDGCTFWYTNEYLKANGSFNWSTRIGSFKLPGCGNPDFTIGATPASATVTAGNSASYAVTVTATGGFTGSVTFGASGLPAGASAVFNPTSVAGSGTSTLTVSTSATTPAGSYALTITGNSGTLSHSAGVTLVVNPPPTPDFSLSATPSSQTVVQGSGTSYTVNIARTNGFTGAVTFSATGWPSGAGGTFNPNPAAGASSTLSVTTSTTTPAGSYPITITGTSGALTHSTSVTLVVNLPADYSLSISPSSVTVAAGSSASYTVNISRVGGFAGSITFSISGLPAGAAGTFSPNPSSNSSSALTITTATSTTPGSYLFTVSGTSGPLSHSATATLVVNPAAAGDFSLSATPTSRSIKQGTSTTYTVNITRTVGFTGGVTFSVSGLPGSSTATFSPNPGTGASSTLTVVSTGAGTPIGTFVLTITGSSGSLSHTTTVTLIITEGCFGGNGDC